MLPLLFFTFSSDDVASTTAVMGEIFTDVKALFFIIVGLMLGLWVISGIIKALRPEEK
ncbi:unnamed protein product [marine sediment metagenome]|uniref:Uncharacterized protein n=1 Tax=marine sediment metagenome TaxID=412755 RepID=X1LJQ8_9ZZZZ